MLQNLLKMFVPDDADLRSVANVAELSKKRRKRKAVANAVEPFKCCRDINKFFKRVRFHET